MVKNGTGNEMKGTSMNFKVKISKNGKSETKTIDKWDLADICERASALGFKVEVELA